MMAEQYNNMEQRLRRIIQEQAKRIAELESALIAVSNHTELVGRFDNPLDVVMAVGDLLDDYNKLVVKVQKLEKDAARIDWLQRQDFNNIYFAILQDQPHDGSYAVSIGAGYALGRSFREALDAAMKESRA